MKQNKDLTLLRLQMISHLHTTSGEQGSQKKYKEDIYKLRYSICCFTYYIQTPKYAHKSCAKNVRQFTDTI